MKQLRKEYNLKKDVRIVKACIAIIDCAFQKQMATLKTRSQEDQSLIGNNLTVIESEIKHEIKKLL